MPRNRQYLKNGFLELLAEGFLGLEVPVAVPLVERMRPIADYIGTQADGGAAALARPFLGAREQALADALRAIALVHHQAANFCAGGGLHGAINENRDPAGDFAIFEFSDEDRVVWGAARTVQAPRDFFRRRRIRQLPCEFGDTREVRLSRPAYFAGTCGGRRAHLLGSAFIAQPS